MSCLRINKDCSTLALLYLYAMLLEFKKHIENDFSFLKDKRLLVAVSGGIDSIVLTHLCHQLNFNFAIAHCNFKLRGKESDVDEDFVIQLGERLGVEVFVQPFNTEAYSKNNKLSIQMSARELRYNWFTDLAEQLQFNYVLTAHHADDNLETFLINFLRGTGINGLTGIPEIQGQFVRPLLNFSREKIVKYAENQQLEWREDSSNASRKYLRNKLRHEVLPILKNINPEVLETFRQTISNIKDTQDIVTESVKAVTKRALVLDTETEKHFLISEFKKVNNSKAYLFEFFKDYGFTEWNDVEALLDAQSGKYVMSNSHRLIKHREVLILTDRKNSDGFTNLENPITIDSHTRKIHTPQGFLVFHDVKKILEHSDFRVYLDKSKLEFPLHVRHWQEGDRFSPYGMTGQKKLSKFFKDEKYSTLDKERQLILCSGDHIVWVIGKRLDNRFKVTSKTKEILEVELLTVIPSGIK